MADKKISELDSQTGAQTADDDVFVIADVSANVTKKITLSELDNALAARDFNFGDNTKLLMGDSNDLEIFHNASDSIINDAGTGSLKLQTGGSTKLEVTSGGVTVTGSVTGSLTGNADTATQVYVTDPDPDTDANHFILGVASTSSGNKAVVLDGGVYFNPSLNRLYSNSIFISGSPTSNGFVGFEGATSDSFETFLYANDPTADRAIYLPDASGTLTVTGASQNVSFGTLTADGGISVDNITIDGTEIDLSSGDLTLDVAGDIILDAEDNGKVQLHDGGTYYGLLRRDNNDFQLYSIVQDGDMVFRGNDGGSNVTALTLDMSDAGTAIFNNKVGIGATPNTTLTLSDGTDEFDFGVTTNQLMIKSVTSDGSDDQRIIIDAGNGGQSSARGAFIALSGNEASSNAGQAIYQMGNVTGASHVFRKAGGNDAVTIDSSGDVGIGTAPDFPLHVSSTGVVFCLNSTSGAVAQRFNENGTARFFINTLDGSNGIKFVNGDGTSERMRITSDGSVGIGTSSPSAALQVEGTTNGLQSVFGLDSSGLKISTFQKTGNDAGVILDAQESSNGTLTFATTGTERMRIDSSGNVGIANTAPSSQTAGAQNLVVGTSGATGITIASSNNNNGSIFFSDGTTGNEGYRGFLQYNHTNDFLAIATAASERLRIKSTGEMVHTLPSEDTTFAAGTESTWNRFEIFQDRGAADTASGIAFRSQSGTAPAGIVSVALNTTGGREELAFITSAGNTSSEAMRIDENGNVGIGTDSPQVELHLKDTGGLSRIRLEGTASSADNFEFGQGTTGVSNAGFEIYDVDATATRFVINSSGNVGIGTTSPSQKLHVYGGGILVDNGSSAGTIYFHDTTNYINLSGDALQFANNGSEHMRINSSGFVGIGATNQDAPLTIQPAAQGVGTNVVQSWMYALTSGSEFDLKLNQVVSSGLVKYSFTLRNNGTSYADNLVLDRGNVAIGISNPTEKFTVVNSSSGIVGRFTNNTNQTLDLGVISGSGSAGGVSFNNANSGYLSFQTGGTEVMRILASGAFQIQTANQASALQTDYSGDDIIFGSSAAGNSNAYFGNLHSAANFFYAANNTSTTSTPPVFINRQNNDGLLIIFRQGNADEGSIEVSGSTVSLNGFSGKHESSGISTSVQVGTVVSTIDELDVYPNTQPDIKTGEEAPHPKAGQTRADHAKVKVSDTVGDKRVYGVVNKFTPENKVMVTSLGIGSVLVTGACDGGDLLESNGDGTAKVQSDDIIRSKTIGKVTIGSRETGVKLVSCVMYCG